MRAVKQGLLWALAAGTSAAAMAGTVHKVRFAQPAQILVWEDGDLIAQGDHIQLSQSHDAKAKRLIGAGTLLPVSGDNSSRTISIASNTAFSLKSGDMTDPAGISVRVLGARENAQVRASGVDESTFRQAAKTAARPGTPASQAIELEISWASDDAPDLFIIAD